MLYNHIGYAHYIWYVVIQNTVAQYISISLLNVIGEVGLDQYSVDSNTV